MYVFMYVCMYLCIYVCIYVFLYLCMSVCMCMRRACVRERVQGALRMDVEWRILYLSQTGCL